MESEIEAHGGSVGGISKATHLLCGDKGLGTSKHTAAVKKGLVCLDEDEVRAMMAQSGGGGGGGGSSSSSSSSAPLDDLEDGERRDVQGSAAAPYVVKRGGPVYSCSCPAWRNQSLPINSRTCKHIRGIRGDGECSQS